MAQWTQIGPQDGFLGPFRSYFGSVRALELCKIAIGFISTKFQAKPTIPGPVWTHFSFFDFLDPHGQDLGPENEAVLGTRV